MPETEPRSEERFLVARQDYQMHEVTHYLAARPSRDGLHWQWITEAEEALGLAQDEARRLAGQYNGLPEVARRGSVARVEEREAGAPNGATQRPPKPPDRTPGNGS